MQNSFVILLIYLSSFSFAQTSIEGGMGGFTDFYPWGDGYIGMSQRYYGLVVSTKRDIKYFNKSGALTWEKKLNPVSYSNDLLVHENSDFAFVVNTGTLDPAALLEKRSNSNFMTVYRYDKKGSFKTFNLNFAKTFGTIFGNKMERVYLEYLTVTSTGIVGVLSKLSAKDKWTESYAIFKVTNDGIAYAKKLENSLTQEEFEKIKVSRPDYCMVNEKLIVSQTKLTDEYYEIHTSTLETDSLKVIETGLTEIQFSGNHRYGQSREDIIPKLGELNHVQHTYTTGNSSVTVIVPTLGSLFRLFVYKDQVYGIGCHYETNSGNGLALSETKGLYYFKIATNNNGQSTKEEITYFDFASGKGKVAGYSSMVVDNNLIYAVKYGTEIFYYVNEKEKGVAGEEFDLNVKEALTYGYVKEGYSTIKIDNIEYPCEFYQLQNDLIIYEKTATSYAGFRKANIYRSLN